MPHSSDRAERRTPARRPCHDEQHFSRAAEEQQPVTPASSRPGTEVGTRGLRQEPPHLIERRFHRGTYLPLVRVLLDPHTTVNTRRLCESVRAALEQKTWHGNDLPTR